MSDYECPGKKEIVFWVGSFYPDGRIFKGWREEVVYGAPPYHKADGTLCGPWCERMPVVVATFGPIRSG